MDELFSFSDALGAEYSGEWADASTFEIAVITPYFNQTSQPQVRVRVRLRLRVRLRVRVRVRVRLRSSRAESNPNPNPNQVGVTTVNITAGSPLYGASGVAPASRTETPRLQGDARLLIPPGGDRVPVILMPAVREFVLLDAEAGGVDVVGIGASLLLRFDREAHTLGMLRGDFFGQEGQELSHRSDTWNHCELASECCCDKHIGSTSLSACPDGATPPPWGCDSHPENTTFGSNGLPASHTHTHFPPVLRFSQPLGRAYIGGARDEP